MGLKLIHSAIAHIRFDGHSADLELAELGVNVASGDDDIRRAVARYLDVSPERLRDHVVDRHESGNVTIRPQAVFG